MPLIVNKAMLGPAYDYLRATKPFSGWKLPPSSEVVFELIPNKKTHGCHYIRPDGKHTIQMSTHLNRRHVSTLATLAHEMIHLYLNKINKHSTRNPHNALFSALADRVCKIHIEFERWCF